MKYSIVIADDHLLIAKAIGAMIDGFHDFHVLYEVENGLKLQEKFRHSKNIPDIVLLDVSMPSMDGFETALWLKTHHPGVTIMALSVQDDEQSLIKMIRNGARGYLLKNVHPAELENALQTLRTKGMYFPEWATSRIFLNLSADQKEDQKHFLISPREQEFLIHACSELTYKEIAEKMFCSPRTVESYRDSLFEKLKLKTRTALALYAVKAGLVKL